MFSTDDTIVAIATPLGRGGLGVVRVSGRDTTSIASRVLDHDGPLAPRHATLTRVVMEGAAPIDEVVATWFGAPHSYTGEDVLEISAHGSPVVLREIVRAALRAGARLAEPGEFTLRAYLNGRLDLVQAEAVADLVNAVTPVQARAAFDQLEGTLTEAIGRIDERLFDVVVRLEASIDFPDEGYHFIDREDVAAALAGIADEIDGLLVQAGRGRLIREGRQVALLGKPNVGKSSLFNYLVGADRAIVTDIPGTTRDLVTEAVDFEGIRLGFVDTAGLGETADVIEKEGVARSRRAMAAADVLIVILDRSRELEDIDYKALESTSGRHRLVVVNKADLPSRWTPGALGVDVPSVVVSLKSGLGLEAFRGAMREVLGCGTGIDRDLPPVTNVRHEMLLREARMSIGRAAEGARQGGSASSEEFVLADLIAGRRALEAITGRRVADDVLQAVFSRFCIGK